MKLIKFRIKNYKSIIDSGPCDISNGVTVFAGKNESGKTSILEALEDFSVNREIRQEAKPLQQPKEHEALLEPEICATFTLDENTKNELVRAFGAYASVLHENDIEILKNFRNEYVFGRKTFEVIKSIEADADKESFRNTWNRLIQTVNSKNKRVAQYLSKRKNLNFSYLKRDFYSIKKSVTGNPTEFFGENAPEDVSHNLFKLLENIEAKIAEFDALIDAVKQHIPNFILFSSFDESFPDSVPFSDFGTNEWIGYLETISDFDTKLIQSPLEIERLNHLHEINVAINQDHDNFWTQDASKLDFNVNNNTVFFWIKENNRSCPPSTRSKGRQWHLAFYMKISARAKENVSNIIMIDEPGLYLHATAQRDILNKLEDSAQESQVIFSTHSPYLLEADKLGRIRLIRKENITGTKIENKVHALADKETLTPILTAIGLDLGSSILTHEKINNVVVEGPSDAHYLNALKQFVDLQDNINFVGGGGVGNMWNIGTILQGWGGKVVYLLDNDAGKKPGERNLKKNLGVGEESIVTVLEKEGSIEDIFSLGDFQKFVLCNETNTNGWTCNSKYVKTIKADKVMLAKNFLDACQSDHDVDLDGETRKNITELFEKIVGAFRPHENSTERQVAPSPAKKKVVAKKSPKKN